MHVPDLTRRLDGLESGLPRPASRVLHAQRSAVAAVGGVARDAIGGLSHVAGTVIGSARDGVTGMLGRHHPDPVFEPAPTPEPEPVPPRPAPTTARPVAPQVADDLEGLSRGELLGRARELDIDGRTKMSKQQLVAAIRAAS